MGEMEFLGVPFLESYLAYFLQDGQIMPHGLDAQPLFEHDEVLKLTDKLLVELTEREV